ncbi:MAG: sigma-70 family RNA polymerase sigma factor [Dehalococcoidia bacterium]|nr:sigma-70 family RNA polymerase sigma factor [Dehalococcoidia bacterium]
MDIKQEKELVGWAQKDPQAFGVLYEQNYALIFGYVLKRVADLQTAEDITSETFLKALDKIGQFRWQNIPFSAWLYRIAGNEIANYFRRNGHYAVPLEAIRQPESLLGASSEIIDAEEELKRHEEFLSLQGMIRQLPSKYQEVIALRFFEEKTTSEIADILGKREGTVRSLLSRGLEKLRLEMG